MESVPPDVIEVPENKFLGERTWATPEMAPEVAGKEEKVGSQ